MVALLFTYMRFILKAKNKDTLHSGEIKEIPLLAKIVHSHQKISKHLVQNPTKQQVYGHLLPITKTIKIRRTRHVEPWWRNRDELVSDVLLWSPAHGRAKAGRPARTYIQQLCADTGCSPEYLPKAMDDREVWRERARNIRADSAIWWWDIWTLKLRKTRVRVFFCLFFFPNLHNHSDIVPRVFTR